jgi:hypothetical protein
MKDGRAYLVQHMTHVRDDLHLELSLHMSDHELLIKSISLCEYQQAGSTNFEEVGRECDEPTYVW